MNNKQVGAGFRPRRVNHGPECIPRRKHVRVLSTSVRSFMFQAYVSPAGTFKTKEFLNKPLISKKKKKKRKRNGMENKRTQYLQDLEDCVWPNSGFISFQSVIAGLLECISAKTQVERLIYKTTKGLASDFGENAGLRCATMVCGKVQTHKENKQEKKYSATLQGCLILNVNIFVF